MDTYQVRSSGDPKTDQWRLFYELKDGTPISPFHDIPLATGRGTYNMVVEIPRGLNAKLEINKGEALNPIKQDIKRGNLRFVHDVFPYKGYIWNYGAFPQTWEDPTHKDDGTGAYGDNDPLDVCEIGSETAFVGQVKEVKVLGVLALIDEGETDWKVITIDVNDPLAAQLDDISQVEQLLPGFTMATYEWFRTYKIPAGSPPNTFAFNGEAKDAAFAKKVIDENHAFWRKLHSGATPASGTKLGNGEKYEVVLTNTQLSDSAVSPKVSAEEAKSQVKNLGDHGNPTSNTATLEDDSDGSVKVEVERVQRLKPHATATLSAVLSDVAAAIGGTDGRSGDAIAARLAASANIHSVLHGSGAPASAAADAYYSVAFAAADSGSVVFGVYQPKSPHPLPHIGELASSLLSDPKATAGFGEIVAAGFASSDGHLVLNSGAGRLTFKFDGAKYVRTEASVAAPSAADDLHASRAPLALLAAL